MKIAIMQPYFLPYMGYWQLMHAVDAFVVYDNIQYTKKGWINRNRYLAQGKPAYFSIPLRKDSDYLHVNQRAIQPKFDRKKLLRQIHAAYAKAPCFEKIYTLFEEILNYQEENLFLFIYHSLLRIREYLGVTSKLIISSELPIDHELRAQEKVLGICEHLVGRVYINPPGGRGLYQYDAFEKKGIELKFIEPVLREYEQLQENFVAGLSILDVLMFNSQEKTKLMLEEYEIKGNGE